MQVLDLLELHDDLDAVGLNSVYHEFPAFS